MQIEIKVSHHPSGRYTLMKREQNERHFSDERAHALFGNDDMGQFYKEVALLLSKLHTEGHEVRYEDV